ncbi:paternally-expressed gene 3 protein-like isoform X2 [Odontomachus brunneus]|uniref:paternally-expressed gene 3 protein-like isoform X2 n=1 Tax=Odontomachus brunneus TaxID=486640 RepID=UPI0013F2B01E|nr:paternally-expressed gene 3 protein-like isoform X2 [Odontomachus brunneus]
MAGYKVYLALSALVACHVANASYEYERLKAQIEYKMRAPWNSKYDSYVASSELMPHYYDSYEDHYASSSERFPNSGFKKEPNEDKGFKKTISSFYIPFVNKDSPKHKELILNSRNAYCQEIKMKSVGLQGEPRQGITTCYRCKDPKTKSTFERCLYNNEQEESAATDKKVESFLPESVNFRHRRSNSDQYEYPYRFADEHFTDTAQDVPAAYESKGEKCEKVVKGSMVCMVCKNAKTNGKYEQCSYMKEPREKAYSYTKSIFGKPQEQKSESNSEEPEEGSYSESSGIPVSDKRRDYNPVKEEAHEYSYPSEPRSKKTTVTNEQDEVQNSPTTGCKQVQKDSKTCMVCKNPKNGGTYEKCTYSYEPSDKLYKYTRSKSFGYPKKSTDSSQDSGKVTGASKNSEYPRGSDSTHEDAYFDRSAPSAYPHESGDEVAKDESGSDSSRGSPYYSEYSNPEGFSEVASSDEEHESVEDRATSPSNYEGSSSERHSANIDKNHCKQVQKGSMTCMVCKDPKTGNDFEECSYSYEPKEKLFSYSQSSSFGNPENSKGSQQEESEKEHPDDSEVVKESYEPYTYGPSYEASTKEETKSENAKEHEAVDSGYLQTAKKKAEIEGFLQNFQKEDHSKCKKIMRDKMTCYQCVDDEGFQKEECVFVTGQEPDKLEFRKIKEFQMDPASSFVSSTKKRRANPPPPPLEPVVAASKNSYVRLEKPDNDYPDEASDTAEETKGVEPDYTSETQARYNKVLGMTLPAYMHTTSEHEAAFDELVASSHRDER